MEYLNENMLGKQIAEKVLKDEKKNEEESEK